MEIFSQFLSQSLFGSHYKSQCTAETVFLTYQRKALALIQDIQKLTYLFIYYIIIYLFNIHSSKYAWASSSLSSVLLLSLLSG